MKKYKKNVDKPFGRAEIDKIACPKLQLNRTRRCSGITEHSLSSPPPPFSETTSAASGVSSGIGGSGKSHFRSGSHGGSVINSYGFIETPLYTFTLPDLTVFQGA